MQYTPILWAQEPGPEAGPEAGQATGQTTAPGAPPPASPGMWDIALMMLPVIVLFYFLMIRPGRRQEAERKKLIDTLKKDDEVLTYAGVFGKIVSIHETEDEAVIKLEDNTRVKVLKSSILRNISGEKALKEEQAKK